MRSWMLPALAGLLAVALVGAGGVAVVQSQRLSDERARVDDLTAETERLAAELDGVRDELDGVREQLDAARTAGPDEPPAGTDPADDGGSSGLLDGLLGGAVPGQECLAPDGGLDGVLDGLFGGTSLPDEPDALVEVISGQVAELRELTWDEPVEARFLDAAAVGRRLDALLDEDLDPVEVEATERLLVTLGAIPAGSDLERLQRDLLDDQVAGYYVPETGELVVRVPDDGRLRPADRVTLAHELGHALADQELGIPDRSAAPFADDADASLAALAVVEGDASLLMNRWALAELSLGDQLAMALDPSIAAAQRSLDDVPHVLQRELLYPYTVGLDWACRTFLEGGWEAIDAAYADPPATSAEVLWGEPIEPATTASLSRPEGYDELTTTTMGAAHLLWLLEAPGGDTSAALDEAEGLARAWAGGDVTVWAQGDATAVGLALVDGGDGSAPLCETVRDWYGAAFPDASAAGDGELTRFRGEVQAAVHCEGDDVALVVGPDEPTVDAVLGR